MVITERGVDYKKLIDIIPVTKISNYAYSGDSNLRFKDVTDYWGLDTPSHSNGSAYGDLDNDGDLDLIVTFAPTALTLFFSPFNLTFK